MKQAQPFDGLNSKKKRHLDEPLRVEENARLRKLIGSRLATARQINQWTQEEGAVRIGYANSTQLSLIEDGTRGIPLAVLLRASTAYGVSVDYLMGVSDEPERDPKAAERQATLRHVEDVVSGMSVLVATQVQRYLTAGAPSVLATRAILKQAQEAIEAVHRFRELNQEAFDGELRGAATVLRTIDALHNSITQAKGVLDRHDRVGMAAVNTAAERAGVKHPLLDQQFEMEPTLF